MSEEYDGAVQAMTKDRAINEVTGQGTAADKTTHTHYAHQWLGEYDLSNIYQFDGMGRKLIDKPIDDALNNWRSWGDELGSTLFDVEDSLGVMGAIKEAQASADVFGGSILVMIVKNQKLDSKLDISSIGKGDLLRLAVFDCNLAEKYNPNMDIAAEDFMKPEYYQIRSTSAINQNIHPSRVIEFEGDTIPLSARLRSTNDYWMQSKFYRYWDALTAYNVVMNSTQTLLSELNLDIISVENLPEITSSKMSESFEKRIELHSLAKSIHKMIIKDKNETLDRNTLSLSGLDSILGLFQTALSAVADIPTTELFGTSAKGLNATGEGDERSYHSRLEADQKALGRILKPLDEAIVRTTLGDYPEELSYEWNPLKVMSAKDKADLLDKLATASEKFINMCALKPIEVRAKLETQKYFDIEDVNEVITTSKGSQDAKDAKPNIND